MKLQEVPVQAVKPERLKSLIGPDRRERFDNAARTALDALSGRVVWNINSTRTGGGVAEMLRVLLAYARGVGIETRWFVIDTDPGFLLITKRIHNCLSASPGDGRGLGVDERAYYERVLRPNVEELLTLVRPGDIVLLHDPQVAGLAPQLARAGVTVVWRCHIGSDSVNEYVEKAWEFLYPYLADVDAYVFTRRVFAPPWADPQHVFVIPPSIDPFAPKNQAMESDEVEAVLRHVGLIGGEGPPPRTEFTRANGSRGRVNRHTGVLKTGPPPPPDVPMVVQVSRWDRMKDMAGVMTAFAEHVAAGNTAHLVLAGPEVTGVADDPEGASVLAECLAVWRGLPHAERARVHLACVPMRDPDENFIVINALQRHAAVVTQKSIAEGFGLTVAEAMWKSKPIVASAVGGIIDQIVSGEHGLLVDDPHDLGSFGRAVRRLLDDPPYAASLAANARRRAQTDFLGDRHLEQYAQLFVQLDEVTPP